MAYNKAGEEKKWRLWKDAEEKHLRELGVGENVIAQLRVYDWDCFKEERRFYEHNPDTGTYIDSMVADESALTIQTVEDFHVASIAPDTPPAVAIMLLIFMFSRSFHCIERGQNLCGFALFVGAYSVGF